MAVGELQAGLELDGELCAIRTPSTIISRDIRRQFGSVVILRVQERKHLNLHGIGTIVVGTSRIKAGDLVGGADGDRAAARSTAILHAAACGEGCKSRDRSQRGDNLLVIHYGILSFYITYRLYRQERYNHKDEGVMLTRRFISGYFIPLSLGSDTLVFVATPCLSPPSLPREGKSQQMTNTWSSCRRATVCALPSLRHGIRHADHTGCIKQLTALIYQLVQRRNP